MIGVAVGRGLASPTPRTSGLGACVLRPAVAGRSPSRAEAAGTRVDP
jgi:hypothetical protein